QGDLPEPFVAPETAVVDRDTVRDPGLEAPAGPVDRGVVGDLDHQVQDGYQGGGQRAPAVSEVDGHRSTNHGHREEDPPDQEVQRHRHEVVPVLATQAARDLHRVDVVPGVPLDGPRD